MWDKEIILISSEVFLKEDSGGFKQQIKMKKVLTFHGHNLR
jgi:hypothetical protein